MLLYKEKFKTKKMKTVNVISVIECSLERPSHSRKLTTVQLREQKQQILNIGIKSLPDRDNPSALYLDADDHT